MALNFPIPTSVGQVYQDPTSGNTYVCTSLGPPAQWVGSGSSTSLDSTYLRKDASNDPVTGNLLLNPTTNVSPLTLQQPVGNTTPALKIENSGSGNSIEANGFSVSQTGITALPSGTVASPSITTSGDTNTGIYFPAADTIGLVEGGTEVVRINSSGNVGIGTTSPSNKLSIRGSAGPDGHTEDLVEISTSANSFSAHAKLILSGFVGDTGPAFIGGLRPPSGDVNLNSLTLGAGGSERMRITNDGNVGIGTSSPTSTLTVSGTTSISGNTSITSSTASTSTTSGALVVTGGLGVGGALFAAGTATAGKFSPTANTVTGNGMYLPGQDTLAFSTAGVERIRISSAGNVGINYNSTPPAPLFVWGNAFAQTISAGIWSASTPSETGIWVYNGNRQNALAFGDTSFYRAGYVQTIAGVLELGGRQNGINQADNTDPQIRIYDRGVDFPSISTTASGANAFLSGTNRRLFVSTSSLRYKKDIEPVEETYADAILDLQAVYYRSKSLVDNPDWSWWGFIAEDVFKVDPRLVTYIEDPEDPDKLIPDGVQYDRISVLLQDVVKRQSLKISELEQRIYSLEQQVIS